LKLEEHGARSPDHVTVDQSGAVHARRGDELAAALGIGAVDELVRPPQQRAMP
jgi:hypothetical protein